MIPVSINAVRSFRVLIDGTWHPLTLRFRGDGVGSRFHEAVWQRVGTLKAIKASSLQFLIDTGEVVPV